MTPWLRYLIAVVVFCHGFIYVRIGAVLPGPIKDWKGSSALLGGIVAGDPLIALVRAVHVIAGIAILVCAVGLAVAAPWWRLFAIGGASVGLVAFAFFWDGQTKLLFEEGVIGVAVSAALLLAALIFPQPFGG